DERADKRLAIANRNDVLNQLIDLTEGILDLLGGNVLAAVGLEEPLLATRDPQVAVGIDSTEVAGVEPAVRDRLGVLFRHVPIAGGDRFALEPDDACAFRLTGFRHDADLRAVDNLADRTDFVLGLGVDCDTAGGFSQTVTLAQAEADQLEEVENLGSNGS